LKKSPKPRGAQRPRAVKPPPTSVLAAALTSLGEGVIVVTRKLQKDGLTIEFANESFCRMTGYAAEELTGEGHGLLHVDQGDRVRLTDWLRTRGRPLPLTGESTLRRKDGSTLSAAWIFSPIKDAQGKVNRLVASYRDTTERRGQLEVEGHTQRMEAVGRLAGGVAHDFNNLLSVINGYCEMLAPQLNAHPTALHSVTEIHNAGRKASNLTRQLLAFGRRQPMVPRVIDINRFIQENAEGLTRLLGDNGKLVLELETALPHVRTDPVQFQQVLLNLTLNARDALRDRGRVTISTARREIKAGLSRRATDAAPGRYVQVTVNDNGTGMDRDTLGRLFEPFFTTKPSGKGSGLGLATVYGVVQQSGGFISARSELLVGSTFEILLPEVNEPAEYPLNTPTPAIPSLPVTKGHEVVLIVEADEVLRKMVAGMLTADGYRALDAATPAEAKIRAAAAAKPVQLLVANLSSEGEKLARTLHKAEPDLRVLNACNHNAQRTLHWLPAEHQMSLPKPFALSELLKVVRRLLDA
jgi:two-component system, cell cycle sensor histidine kinase and response regulator CckA